MSTDDAHCARLVHELESSREIDAFDVRVAVRNAVVTVTGEIGSAAERLAVRSIVLADPETAHVVDDLRVTPLPGEWRLHDDEITALAAERLGALPELADVRVSCEFHVVRLGGSVAEPAYRRLAHHIARTTRGVHVVLDEIALTGTAVVPAAR
jgi:osmotically-inducible protein OsmY